MKKLMFLMVMALVVFLAAPMAHSDDKIKECESKCLSHCSNKTDEAFNGCFKVCMDVCLKPKNPQKETMKLVPDVPPPTPVNPPKASFENSANIVVAVDDPKMVCANRKKSSGNSCCQDTKGETKGYCPEGYTYYKDVSSNECPNGKCFKYGDDCMKAGWGFCYTCSACGD